MNEQFMRRPSVFPQKEQNINRCRHLFVFDNKYMYYSTTISVRYPRGQYHQQLCSFQYARAWELASLSMLVKPSYLATNACNGLFLNNCLTDYNTTIARLFLTELVLLLKRKLFVSENYFFSLLSISYFTHCFLFSTAIFFD